MFIPLPRYISSQVVHPLLNSLIVLLTPFHLQRPRLIPPPTAFLRDLLELRISRFLSSCDQVTSPLMQSQFFSPSCAPSKTSPSLILLLLHHYWLVVEFEKVVLGNFPPQCGGVPAKNASTAASFGEAKKIFFFLEAWSPHVGTHPDLSRLRGSMELSFFTPFLASP